METKKTLTCVSKSMMIFFFLPPKNQPQCSFEEGLCGCGRSFIWVYLLFICLAAPLTFLFSLAHSSHSSSPA